MPKKNKFNPSGYPVLTKKNPKGAHIKNIHRNVKRLLKHIKKK